jgi:hypothetical protein
LPAGRASAPIFRPVWPRVGKSKVEGLPEIRQQMEKIRVGEFSVRAPGCRVLGSFQDHHEGERGLPMV